MTEYRVVIQIYDGEDLIATSVGHMPQPLEGDRSNGFEMGLSHLHKEPENVVHLDAVATITRTVVD